jgi:hypothetical protein
MEMFLSPDKREVKVKFTKKCAMFFLLLPRTRVKECMYVSPCHCERTCESDDERSVRWVNVGERRVAKNTVKRDRRWKKEKAVRKGAHGLR